MLEYSFHGYFDNTIKHTRQQFYTTKLCIIALKYTKHYLKIIKQFVGDKN